MPHVLQEDCAPGSWHADRLIDLRQCVLFCYDETRAALFVRGLRQELEVHVARVPNVLMLDPVTVGLDLCDRPTTVRDKWIRPDRLPLELVAMLSTRH